MSTLGVLVTCYNEYNAVSFSLNHFRKIYRNSRIYLTTESTVDYSALTSLGNISVNNVADTMYFIKHVTDQNFLEPHFQQKILTATYAFLNRVKQAVEYCQSDYLLLMDPDTLVNGPLAIPTGAKLLGSRINTGFPPKLREIIREVPGAIDIDCWGATPAIIHCETYLKAYKYVIETDPTILPRLAQTFYAIFAHDVILPIIFALQGEPEVLNTQIIECNRESFVYKVRHIEHYPLIHQFKQYYDHNSNSVIQH